MKEPSFDLETVYDSQIAPLMTQIIEICKTNGVPILASFCYRNNHDEDGIISCATTNIPRLKKNGKTEWHPEKFQEAFKIIRASPQAYAVTITKAA